MTGTGLAAHLLSLTHGLAAALISIAAFYLVGFLLLPRRWQASLRWPDSIVAGLTLYVLLCWVATSSRHIPVIYITLAVGAALWVLMLLRFRSLHLAVGSLSRNLELRKWLSGFCLLYVFAYWLVGPPAGPALLALPADGALDLVTYARYARHLLAFGTANIELATFEYLRSPASAHLLAWHSLFFLGDPLDAAIPLLFMMAALFGAIAVDFARSLFGLSWRVALVIAAIAVCSPMFRWVLTTYSLGELVSATAVLYLSCVFGRAVATRSFRGSLVFAITGGTLLFFSAWSTIGSAGSIVRGVVEVARRFSPLAVFGLPSAIPLTDGATDVFHVAALVLLPFVPAVWSAVVWTLRRFPGFGQIGTVIDRQLAGALVIYIGAGVIVGNVAVQAVNPSRLILWPGAWRELNQIGRVPFQAFTLKVADQPNGLSTALSMYYMPGRKAHVIGRGVALDELPFENVSRHQPMFIHNFGCDGVGHADTVPAPPVGCLLMAPPSMTVGTSYRLNRTYLFLGFDPMPLRDPGGRWNTRSTLNLRLLADPQRTGLDREMYINFLVDPFLPAGTTPWPLTVRWGKERRGEVMVGERLWFSLPVGSADWSGNRLWTAPVAIDFPEGRTILFQEVALTESPRGTIAGTIRADR